GPRVGPAGQTPAGATGSASLGYGTGLLVDRPGGLRRCPGLPSHVVLGRGASAGRALPGPAPAAASAGGCPAARSVDCRSEQRTLHSTPAGHGRAGTPGRIG